MHKLVCVFGGAWCSVGVMVRISALVVVLPTALGRGFIRRGARLWQSAIDLWAQRFIPVLLNQQLLLESESKSEAHAFCCRRALCSNARRI